MRFVSVSDKFFDLCSFDKELLENTNRRPYVFVLRLKYRGCKRNFAIPFRSNLAANIPSHLYFPLPPRHSTKNHKRHGLHYIKIFPIDKKYLNKYWVTKGSYDEMLQNIIEQNSAEIMNQVQEYLFEYENDRRNAFCTNIDEIIKILDQQN